MKALSIRQPWAWAILNAGKRIENRRWKACHYRGPLLMHASAGCGLSEHAENAREVARIGYRLARAGAPVPPAPPALKDLDRGGIVGVCDLIDVYDLGNMSFHRMTHAREGAVCVGCGWRRPTIAELLSDPSPMMPLCTKPDPWADSGGIGLVLANVRPLPFMPYRGALGFFDVPGATPEMVVEIARREGRIRP